MTETAVSDTTKYPTDSITDAAVWLHERGANLITLDGKAAIDGWQEWQTERQSQEDANALSWEDATGAAVICGVGDWRCLDLDKCDEMGTVLKILRGMGLPDNYRWVVKSGSHKGFHIWIWCDEDDAFGSDPKWLPKEGENFEHIEVRWKRCITIAPPSIHADTGKEYIFPKMRPKAPPLEVSAEEVREGLQTVAEPKDDGSSKDRRQDSPSRDYGNVDVEDIESALSALPDSFGSDYKKEWFRMIAAVKDGAPDDDTAEKLLRDWRSEDDPGEYQKKLDSLEGGPPDGSEPITVGSLFDEAKKHGWAFPRSEERYEKDEGRIVHVKPKSRRGETRTVVADFEAEITREITSEDGSRTYHVEGRTREGRAFAFDIDAEEFERARALKSALGSAAGAEAAVRAGMNKHVAPALKMLSDGVEKRTRYKRTGWSEDGFLLPGRTGEEVDAQLPESLPYRSDAEADISQGRDALDNLLRSIGPDKTAPVLSFLLTGPLVRHVQQIKRHGLFIKGRTGSLKTSISQALMCIYGKGFIRDENLLKMGEGMTRNAAMALASFAHDLPIFFDNYKPSTGSGDRDFINLIHNVIEGGEKARLNRNAELKERRDIRAWPLITGEDLPNTDPASLARVLSVEFKWNSGEDNPELTRAQKGHDALPAIGRDWIDWLHTSDGQEALSGLNDTFTDRRSDWAAYLRANRPDMVNILRVASNLATNTLVFDAAKRCPALRDILAPIERDYRDGLQNVAYRMGDYTCESLEARRLLSGIKSLQAAGRVNFAKRLGTDHYEDENRIGYQDGDGYYLVLDLAIEAVENLYQRNGGLGGVTPQTLCSQLDDLDLVARKGRSRTTRPVRIGGGKRKRVLHLKTEALEEEKDSEDEG